MYFTKAALDLIRTSVSTALDTSALLTRSYIDEQASKPSIMDPVHLTDAKLIPEHDNTAAPIEQFPKHDNTAATIELIPEHDNIAASINNPDSYAMTSDEDTSTDTDELLATIERLTSELQLERDNNATIHDNLQYSTDLHKHELSEIQKEMERLRRNQSAQPSNKNCSPDPDQPRCFIMYLIVT